MCHYKGLWVHWFLVGALSIQANQTVKYRAESSEGEDHQNNDKL